MNDAALGAAAEATFEVTNDKIAATDVIVAVHGSAGTAGSYMVGVSAIAAGSFKKTKKRKPKSKVENGDNNSRNSGKRNSK